MIIFPSQSDFSKSKRLKFDRELLLSLTIRNITFIFSLECYVRNTLIRFFYEMHQRFQTYIIGVCDVGKNYKEKYTYIHQSSTPTPNIILSNVIIIKEKANLSKNRLSFNSILLEQTARIFTSGTVWSTDCEAKV